MAFRALPSLPRGGNKPARTEPSVAIYNDKQARFVIPRAILREAGMSDIPGDRFDILVGEGADAGQIAIIPGSRNASTKNGANSVLFTISGLVPAETKYGAKTVRYSAGRRQIILTMPVDFPLTPAAAAVVASAPTPQAVGAAA